jgi:acetyltransferase-like isoleucine patch superfamily enzyme
MIIALLRGFIKRIGFGKSSGIMLIGKGVLIRHPSKLKVGRNFVAEDYCEIHAHSKRGINMGNKVTIGSFALIRPTNYYGGELGEGLTVGDNSNIGPYCYIGCSGYVSIGNNVMISPRVSIYAENHNTDRTDIPMKDQGVKRSEVTIADDCWIASHSVILSGVTIGCGSVVAAGSVVTKNVPPFSIVAGVPAKVIKQRILS